MPIKKYGEKGNENYWRTLLRITDLDETHLTCIVVAFDSDEPVKFPLSDVPEKLRAQLCVPSYIFAFVNIGCDKPKDLKVAKYEHILRHESKNELIEEKGETI